MIYKIFNCIVAYGAIVMNIKACEYYFNIIACLIIVLIFKINKDHYIETKHEWFNDWSKSKAIFNHIVAAAFAILFMFNEMLLPALGYIICIVFISIKQSAHEELTKLNKQKK